LPSSLLQERNKASVTKIKIDFFMVKRVIII